ncbi:MAG: HAD family hydrolase [Erysipelotrichales bacterium]|nr:HAD family hydrolase [Erysipelotrichales bacterium]
MKKSIIFFDVDGTLYDNENKTIPKEVVSALKKLAEHPEYELALATGRSISSLNIIEEILPLFRIQVLINGSYVIDGKNVVQKYALEKNVVARVVEYLQKNNVLFGLIGSDGHVISNDHPEWKHVFSLFGIEVPRIDPDYHQENEIYQLWIFGNNDKINIFSKEFPEVRFVSWPHDGMDVIHKTSSKGESIRILKETYNWDQIIAIGDGLNDLEMFQLADIKVAMGQSHEELKKHATFVTDSVDKNGLVKALMRLNLL